MNQANPVADQKANADLQDLSIETFEIDELSNLEVDAATAAASDVSVSLCSSTCSSSCG